MLDELTNKAKEVLSDKKVQKEIGITAIIAGIACLIYKFIRK